MKRVGVVLILGGMSFMTIGCTVKEKPKEQPSIAAVAKEDKIEVYGEVTVGDTQEISMDFPGIVEKVWVKEGQKVAKGDPLLTLNLDDYKAQITIKENQLKIYNLQLKAIQANVDPQTANVAQLKDTVQVKEGQLKNGKDPDIQSLEKNKVLIEDSIKLARADYETGKAVFDVGGKSKQEIDILEQTLKVKEKERDEVLLNLQKAKTTKQLEIDTLKAEIQSGTAQLSNTDSNLVSNQEVLKVQIDTTALEIKSMKEKLQKPYLKGNELIADEEGLIVYDLVCQKGTQLQSLTTPIMKTMQGNNIVVTMDIPEEYVDAVTVGDNVEIVPYTNQNQSIKGKVKYIAERAVEQYGETVVKAEVAVEEKTDLLKPGITVDVKF
ncbi:MAG: HlyD family secretion protein [Cellulosilyticaceae bacterium]